MTAPTTALADFLLERIAEEEAAAHDRHDSECGAALDSPVECGCDYPARTLADCASRRAVVEEHGAPLCGWTHDSLMIHAVPGACPTLLALVQTYANHPQFRSEWRVGR